MTLMTFSEEALISLLCECYKEQGMYEYATIAYSGYVEDNNDALMAMMEGKLKLVNIRAYTTKEKRNTHLIDFATV